MSQRITAAVIALALIAVMSKAEAASCTLQALAPNGQTVAVPGVGEVALGVADNAAQPAAWQGPLAIGACSVDIGIIELPIFASPPDRLYVTTYSGALRQMSLVDLKACKVSWHSKPFIGAVQADARGLKLGKQRIRFDAQCEIKLER
jgi:hypothetical protein